ncbi:hypothetical protein J6590_010678 [Homalodisca vitripennis]|nr:hypothetical protein J6590_010678 [Homalodisca vitripennis]
MDERLLLILIETEKPFHGPRFGTPERLAENGCQVTNLGMVLLTASLTCPNNSADLHC